MNDRKPDLLAAYAVQTPEENRKLYADWAETYDDGFAQQNDYRLPQMVALILAEQFDGTGPVLDVGAGTGLVAQSIPDRAGLEIDALDISAQMLAVAARKGLYRHTIEADLNAPLEIPDATYAAVVSSGTFTHGHVGPEALDALLRIARPGALFVLAVNAAHFEARGFAAKFESLAGDLDGLEFRRVPIYGAGAAADHRDDHATIAVFRRR